MQKRHLLGTLAVIVVTLISYGLVQMTEARSVHAELVEAQPRVNLAIATPTVVAPSDAPADLTLFETIPDAAMLFATGATLLAIAAGVRRHAA